MKRYNELLFVVDTCQAGTMFKRFNGLRNIIAVASSMKDENSYAHGTRNDIGLAVSDRFTRFLYEYLKSENAEEITLREVFAKSAVTANEEVFDEYCPSGLVELW